MIVSILNFYYSLPVQFGMKSDKQDVKTGILYNNTAFSQISADMQVFRIYP